MQEPKKLSEPNILKPSATPLVPGGQAKPLSTGDDWTNLWGATDIVKNAPGSFYKNLTETINGLVIEPFAAGAKYAQDPGQYARDLALVPKYAQDMLDGVASDYGNYYGSLWESIKRDPFRLASDAAAVAVPVAGTAGKGAKVVAAATKGTSTAGAARKFAHAAQSVGRTVENLDPLAATIMAAGKVPQVGRFLTAAGEGKYTKDLNSFAARIAAETEQFANKDAAQVFFGSLTKEENKALTGMLIWGDKAQVEGLRAANPKLKKAYDSIREYLLADEKVYTELEKIVGENAATNAKLLGMRRWAKQEMGLELDTASAKKMVEGKTHDPVFFRLYSKPGDTTDPFHIFHDHAYRGGVLSRAEKRMAKGEVPTDAMEIMAHHVKSTRDVQGQLKLVRTMEEYLKSKSEWKVIGTKTPPETIEALRKAGYRPFQGPFFQKYFEAMGRAVNDVSDALSRPGDPYKNLADVKAAYFQRELGARAFLNNAPTEIYVPEHVAAWANLQFNPGAADGILGKFLRVSLDLGGYLPYYKALVTVMNPRYWLQVAFSNAIMGAIYGVHPTAMKYAYTLQDQLPIEMRNIVKHDLFYRGKDGFTRLSMRLQEFTQGLDAFFKGGIYIHEAAKQAAREGIIKAGQGFFATQEQAKAVLQRYFDASHGQTALLERVARVKEGIGLTYPIVKQGHQQLKRLEEGKGKLITRMRQAEAQAQMRADIKVLDPIVQLDLYEAELQRVWQKIHQLEAAREKYQSIASDPKLAYPPWGLKKWLNKSYDQVLATKPAGAHYSPAGAIEKRATADVMFMTQLESELQKRLYPKMAKLRKKIADIKGNRILGTFGTKKFSSNLDALDKLDQKIAITEWGIDQLEADVIDKMKHSGELYAKHLDIAADAQMADKFIETANQFYGSYNRLSPWERAIMRRLVPFYTFTKAMTRLAFKLPFMFARRSLIYINLWRAVQDAYEDEFPGSSWVGNYAIIGTGENNTEVAVRVGSFNPFSGLRTSQIGPGEIPSVFDIMGQHPIFRLAVQQGKLRARPLMPGERQVRLNTGEVWEYKGNGHFKRVVAQPSWLKQMWSMFPQSQALDASILGAVQTDRGWIGEPDPFRDRFTAKISYPMGTLERVLTWAVPTTSFNLKKLKERESRKFREIVQQYQREYRSAGPYKKANMRQILQEARAWSGKKYLDY